MGSGGRLALDAAGHVPSPPAPLPGGEGSQRQCVPGLRAGCVRIGQNCREIVEYPRNFHGTAFDTLCW
jgi:hypothetical protein